MQTAYESVELPDLDDDKGALTDMKPDINTTHTGATSCSSDEAIGPRFRQENTINALGSNRSDPEMIKNISAVQEEK